MTTISRHEFLGGMLAFGVAGGPRSAACNLASQGSSLCSSGNTTSTARANPVSAMNGRDARSPGMDGTEPVPPNLRFGVVSDIHIGGKPDAVEQLEKAFRWFASKNVDAVLCPGDIAHSGHIRELEAFADLWHRVFPGGRGTGNGERGMGNGVKLMISTGNHDIDAWGGRWRNFIETKMLAERFNYKGNPEKTWQRLFNQKWELIWRCEVKGYTFIGSQWSSLKPPIEEYFREHGAELRGAKPFFYCQHAHPKGTCHTGSSCVDNGESVRALTPFPNAVAISGHSHYAISDERAVWQGAFTSIGAGCLHEGFGGFEYDNVSAFWHPNLRKNLMASLADPRPWGGDAKAGCCELVEVFDDHLVVHRQSVEFGLPIGPAWAVPIPARKDGPFDFATRAARRRAQGAAPQFAKGARIEARFCPDGHALESAAHKGEPCFYVSFPRARTMKGSRVFDYIVEAKVEDVLERVPPITRKIVAAGFAYPEEKADIPGECLFSAAELPPGNQILFTVTPRDCFGLAGKPLTGKISCQRL